MIASPGSYLGRIEARSRVEGECLIWTGKRNKDGYGLIKIDRKQRLVHRIAWTARHGEPPPETPFVLHRCDNPPCFRDGHLFLGTNQDNLADMRSKGRGRTNGNELRTQCSHGHEYTPENTALDRRGRRVCRTCSREKSARWRFLRRAGRAT